MWRKSWPHTKHRPRFRWPQKESRQKLPNDGAPPQVTKISVSVPGYKRAQLTTFFGYKCYSMVCHTQHTIHTDTTGTMVTIKSDCSVTNVDAVTKIQTYVSHKPYEALNAKLTTFMRYGVMNQCLLHWPCPVHCIPPWRHICGVEVYLHSFFPHSAQRNVPAAWPPENNPDTLWTAGWVHPESVCPHCDKTESIICVQFVF